ncbi:lysophospholipid acyltransferase family protein [Siphonobacter sp. SORGH_AS_0500]|uniref:lysophospholipid acyltransferase family protein n=1 Tax=Siphonobacter sp. SORGH_AS_0500 TaxID=1864824 RepID=UPI002858D99E|nr:lysophospholipid acyltransferase family protein [Siphonobacter sp. SORGH_AS_0500]MDR6195526.1 KDO2-lipid IV(A) lauroyltransferase [Siphonobacter sp. SORGH_AS_0500]
MVLFRVISRIPFKILYLFSDVLFFFIYYIFGYRKQVVLSNLAAAFPNKSEQEREKIAREFFQNFCDFIVETVKTLTITQEEIQRRMKLENSEILHRLVNEEKKTVFTMLGHQMNWEWVSLSIASDGIPADVIYKPLSNDFFEKFMLAIRSRFGIKPVSMYNILRDMVSRRKEPRVIGTLADQAPHHPDSAYWSTFFHQETDFFNGTEKLARKFNTPIVFGKVTKIRRGYYSFHLELVAEPSYQDISSGALTEVYIRWLENTLIEQPALWLWSHKRWKHKRTTHPSEDEMVLA